MLLQSNFIAVAGGDDTANRGKYPEKKIFFILFYFGLKIRIALTPIILNGVKICTDVSDYDFTGRNPFVILYTDNE